MVPLVLTTPTCVPVAPECLYFKLFFVFEIMYICTRVRTNGTMVRTMAVGIPVYTYIQYVCIHVRTRVHVYHGTMLVNVYNTLSQKRLDIQALRCNGALLIAS
jgi:hypothetical protein